MAGFAFLKKHPRISTLLALELVLFLIVSYQVQVGNRISLLEKMFLTVFGPIQEVSQRMVGAVASTVEEQKTLDQLTEENRRLQDKVIDFERIRALYIEAEMENDRLRTILQMPEEEDWTTINAEVIGRSNRRNDFMITINKGSSHGVLRDSGVIGPRGVVGVVYEVSPNYSKIMTVNNPSSVLASLVQRSRFHESYVVGDGLGGRLDNFPNFEAIQIGDLVMTSGYDGLFPKGVHLGRVSQIEPVGEGYDRHVHLEFSTDFSRLEEITILLPTCEEESDALD